MIYFIFNTITSSRLVVYCLEMYSLFNCHALNCSCNDINPFDKPYPRFPKILDIEFSSFLLEYPQYTRPANFNGMEVPAVLLSGNHKEIEKYRQEQSLVVTKKNRPDLLDN